MLTRSLSLLLLTALSGVSAAAPPSEQQLALADNVRVVADSWGYDNCGQPTDAVQLRSITVSPDPPKVGAELTVTVDVDVMETIEDGATADVLVKVGRIKLLQKTFDLCEEAYVHLIPRHASAFSLTYDHDYIRSRNNNATITCPVAPGPYSIVQTVQLPKEVPKTKYIVNVRGYTKDEAPLACVDLTVQWSIRPFFQFWGSGQE
ncbi:ML domain-containing protein [Mycena sanguinolenta]|uniref:Phosphatidylglycerol/phosphatidylinositol transfer protein n=1 Tax=Mycena sanguinolenta TaxID=230812 RepID=A0A8H6ZG49_9AGAR|nr:ML domain-containing protein [Mycena sanguinolenta]